MKSWKIARFAGIDVSVHWTFALLLAWVAFSALLTGGIAAAVMNTVAVIAVFVCVVLHEYGHALAARRFGIATRGITLLPIGGVASLERIPRNPLQELWIAVAGPLVNVAIAGILFLLYPSVVASPLTALGAGSLIAQLFLINVILVVFNMIPAFPMDGGRVFRAVLALFMPYLDATRVAVTVGKVMAVLLGLAGLFVLNNPMLLLVAAFVFFAGSAEARMVEAEFAPFRPQPINAFGQRYGYTNEPPHSPGVIVAEIVPESDYPVIVTPGWPAEGSSTPLR